MGMTIDESIRIFEDRYMDTYVVCGGWRNFNSTINITREDYEAFKVAIHTMRKYQKIEQIIKDHDNGSIPEKYWHIGKIREVLEDEKAD